MGKVIDGNFGKPTETDIETVYCEACGSRHILLCKVIDADLEDMYVITCIDCAHTFDGVFCRFGEGDEE